MTPSDPDTSILIVDDDASLRRTMALILTHKGYNVETAINGAEAVERVRARPFDMILMDICMPVLNGVEALKQIRDIRPHAAVTMITAYALQDLIQDALTEGAFALLEKPVEIDRVVALTEQARQMQQSMLILIVDDDPETRTTLQHILEQQKYRICTACSGEAAIAQARQTPYDILLIDLELPVLNGLETYLTIKEILPEAIAIVFTALSKKTNKLNKQALHSGAYACLYKPLDIDHLIELIHEIENERRKA